VEKLRKACVLDQKGRKRNYVILKRISTITTNQRLIIKLKKIRLSQFLHYFSNVQFFVTIKYNIYSELNIFSQIKFPILIVWAIKPYCFIIDNPTWELNVQRLISSHSSVCHNHRSNIYWTTTTSGPRSSTSWSLDKKDLELYRGIILLLCILWMHKWFQHH